MDHVDHREISGLALAYLGDTVWETEVRLFWVKQGLHVAQLNYQVKKFVNAKQQSKYYRVLLEEVTEEEEAIMRRAKNANIRSFPKSCNNQEYREATAFEALIGAWYLTGNTSKIETFKRKVLDQIFEKKTKE